MKKILTGREARLVTIAKTTVKKAYQTPTLRIITADNPRFAAIADALAAEKHASGRLDRSRLSRDKPGQSVQKAQGKSNMHQQEE